MPRQQLINLPLKSDVIKSTSQIRKPVTRDSNTGGIDHPKTGQTEMNFNLTWPIDSARQVTQVVRATDFICCKQSEHMTVQATGTVGATLRR